MTKTYTKTHSTKQDVVSWLMPTDRFPETLPKDLDSTLDRIHCLITYRHMKDAFTEWAAYLTNTPEGMAYEATQYEQVEEGMDTHTAYMCLHYEIVRFLTDVESLTVFKAYVSKQLHNKDSDFEHYVYANCMCVLNSEEQWLGNILMDPHLSQQQIDYHVSKLTDALWDRATL